MDAVGQTAGAHAHARRSKRTTAALLDLATQPSTELGASERQLGDAIIEWEYIVQSSKGDRSIGEIRPKSAGRIAHDRHVGARHGVAKCIGKEVAERRPQIALSTNRRSKR